MQSTVRLVVIVAGVCTAAAAPAWCEPAAADAATASAAVALGDAMPRLGGFTKVRYTVIKNTGYYTDDQNSLGIEVARIVADGAHGIDGGDHGDVYYRSEIDLAAGGASVRDLYVGWRHGDLLRVQVGQFKVPYAWTAVNSESQLQFADRAGVVDLTYGRDLGVLLGGASHWGDLALHYALAAVNGEGANQPRNVNEKLVYAGRLLVEPLGTVGQDESDLDACRHGTRRDGCVGVRPLRFGVGGSAAYDVNTTRGPVFEQGRRETRYAVEAHVKVSGLAIHGEYLGATLPADGPRGAFGRHGYSIQGGFVLPGRLSWIEPVMRWERVDLNDTLPVPGAAAVAADVDAQERERIVPGVNLYVLGHRAKVQLNYVLTNFTEGTRESPTGDPIIGDAVVAQVQVGF